MRQSSPLTLLKVVPLFLLLLSGCQPWAYVAVTNVNPYSVTEYPVFATGNWAPAVTLAGNNTGIDLPLGIASDNVGSLRIGNGLGGFNGIGGSVTSYVNFAEGNSAPIATIAGQNTGLTAGAGQVALDNAGNIYVIKPAFSNQGIAVYDRGATGDVAPIATISGSNTQISQPNGIAVDGSGKIYVANFGGPNSSITVYSPGSNGNVAPIAVISGPNTGVVGPQALAVTPDGTVYVCNELSAVTIFAPGANGNIFPQRTISGNNTGLYNPNGIAVDSDGDIFISVTGQAKPDAILVFAPGANGNVAPKAIITGDQTGLNYPFAMTIIPPPSLVLNPSVFFRRVFNPTAPVPHAEDFRLLRHRRSKRIATFSKS